MDLVLQGGAAAFLLLLTAHLAQLLARGLRSSALADAAAEAEREVLAQRIGQLSDQRSRERERAEHSWNGWRKFAVARKVKEAENVFSFYLEPHDGKPIPAFLPGQYLTFQLHIPGQAKPVIRCYSLSEGPHERGHYRVTIKKVLAPGAPPGLSSSFFSDQVREGDILDVKAPGGHFHLDLSRTTPVVLIGGGIGITPVLSMLNAIAASGSEREVWFFLGVRHRGEHVMKAHLEALAKERASLKLHVCYSDPADGDVEGRDYQHAGRVSVELFKKVLPSSNFDYYLCGPGPMMNSITEGLKAWGVPDSRVYFESFGHATVKKVAHAPAAAGGAQVSFVRSGKTCGWTPETDSLLDLADKNGVAIDSGCRAGNCGTCLVAVKSGTFQYLTPPGFQAEQGSCLACIAVPKGDLALDA